MVNDGRLFVRWILMEMVGVLIFESVCECSMVRFIVWFFEGFYW